MTAVNEASFQRHDSIKYADEVRPEVRIAARPGRNRPQEESTRPKNRLST